jgi:hypothetical protein
MSSILISTYLLYNNITDEDVQAIAGRLIHRLFLDQPIPRDKFAQITEDQDFDLGAIPRVPILKMSKKKHVDQFFRDGSIRLGCFKYFNAFEHQEIGDPTEGEFILVGRNGNTTAFAEVAGGFNYAAFCCFAGESDQMCIQSFGYDSAFEIMDINAFAQSVQDVLESREFTYGKCLYSKDRVVRGDVPDGFNFQEISPRLINLASEAKFFLKPIHLSHQSEFRFLWQTDLDLAGPLDIKVPNAIKYCRRIRQPQSQRTGSDIS